MSQVTSLYVTRMHPIHGELGGIELEVSGNATGSGRSADDAVVVETLVAVVARDYFVQDDQGRNIGECVYSAGSVFPLTDSEEWEAERLLVEQAESEATLCGIGEDY